MKNTSTLDQLATFALNQLLNGTCLEEACDNLSIFERLDDQEESQFFALIKEKALASHMVLDGDYLRSMTTLETFIHNAKAPLAAHASRGHLTLGSGCLQISIALDRVPEVIATQCIPVTTMGLIALVYFQAKEGV